MTVDAEVAAIMAATRAEREQVEATRCPRCHAQAGDGCTTPNGYRARHHRERRNVAAGKPSIAPRKGLRLTDPQAERIESAAMNGGDYWAPRPGGLSTFGGDAAERQVATALLDKGLFELVHVDKQNLSADAHYRLTADGWRVYATHRLIIRRDGVTIPEGVQL